MAERELCPTCHGDGRINVRCRGVVGGWENISCRRCSGTGKLPPASLYDQLPADCEPATDPSERLPSGENTI